MVLLFVSGSGCSQPTLRWPWQSKPQEAVGITTPKKRLEEMTKFQKEAAKKTPAEQELVANNLARQIENEQDPLIRRHIIRTIGYCKSPQTTAVLQAAASDGDAEVRIACCEAWGRQGGPQAVETLTRLVNGDTDIDVRLAAIRALGEMKDPSAVAPLAEALVDANPAIQHRVVHSLKKVSGKDFGNDANLWRAYAKGETVSEPAISIAERFRRIF
jgi:HEAT repeat protein